VTPPELRGRAVSFNTGVTRLSQVIGPALGGYVARGGGGALASAFYVRAGLAVGAALFVAAVGSCCQQRSAGSTAQRQGRAGAKGGARGPAAGGAAPTPIHRLVRAHCHVYATSGVAAALMMFVKLCRRAVLPLAGSLVAMPIEVARAPHGPARSPPRCPRGAHGGGCAAQVIGLAMTAMGAADLALIPYAGWLMDARGRKAAGVPAFLVMALGFAAVGLLRETSAVTGLPVAWCHFGAAMLIGLGSGLASGINQVLGMDAAPPTAADAATFLGVWRMMSDSGALLGPVAAGFVAQEWSVFGASLGVSCVAVLGSCWLGCAVRETWPRRGHGSQMS
jgi:MFS family permease